MGLRECFDTEFSGHICGIIFCSHMVFSVGMAPCDLKSWCETVVFHWLIGRDLTFFGLVVESTLKPEQK